MAGLLVFSGALAALIVALVPICDLDIHRSAPQWISLHGENAKAREMSRRCLKKGDEDDADVGCR